MADTTSQSFPYSTNGQTRTWTDTYTSTGQLTTAATPAHRRHRQDHLQLHRRRLTNITDALGHNTLTVATYKPGGWPLTVHDQNHTLTTSAYQPAPVADLGGADDELRQPDHQRCSYDSAGELTKATLPDGSYPVLHLQQRAPAHDTITNALSETENLTYNSAGNLTQTLWKNSGGTTKRQHTATFDALGRMLTDVGGVSQTTTYGYDSN